MAKPLTFNELLTKLSNVFKKDMYIYKYKFCIAGNDSDAETEGSFICTLNEEYADLIKSLYKDKEYIFFSDVKKAKKEPETYITSINDDFSQHIIKKKFDSLNKVISKSNGWEELKLSEDDVNEIFFERKLFPLFKDDKTKATFDLAKSAFPIISEKNINEYVIMYNYLGTDEEDNISSLLFSYSLEWFKVDEYIMYLELE